MENQARGNDRTTGWNAGCLLEARLIRGGPDRVLKGPLDLRGDAMAGRHGTANRPMTHCDTERDVVPIDRAKELKNRLCSQLQALQSAAVAWSGGVDSAVVARAAVEVLGERAVAMTAVSPSLAESERRTARREAAAIGIRHIEIFPEEFERPEYRRNAGDRCFFCRDSLYRLMRQKADTLQIESLLNGANVDDLGDHRPGMKAAADYGVISPLIDAGLGKRDVRLLARYWKLSVADKPASPCLSSRIAYGVEVTEERVRRVEQAEAAVRRLTGVAEFRVRFEPGELARIEVPVSDLSRLMTDPVRSELVVRLKALGFRAVTVDLQGFRSGSLNEALVTLTGADAS